MRFRSLGALALGFMVAFLLVTLGTGLVIFNATHEAIVELVDKRIAGESSAISGSAGDRNDILERINDAVRDRDTADIGVELTDAAGRHLGGNVRLTRRLPPGYSALGADDRIKGLTQGRALVRDIGGGLVLTTIAETEPIDEYNTMRLRIYLLGFGAIIVLVVTALAVFVRTVRRRITAVNSTAEAIIDGDMRRRVVVRGGRGEFDEQARIFNRMLDRINLLMGEISDISNDIAHDLRTPLARLHNQLSRIERHAETSTLRDEAAEARDQADKLLEMFAAVLRIAEVEGGDRRAAFERLDLGALAAETGAMLVPVAQEADHTLTVEAHDAVVAGDRQLLNQAIINLIVNALRHTPPGSTIRLTVAPVADGVALTVADNGPGIAADQRDRALRRFGRIDKSRARPGHGLGLPLVDAIARLHRGTLELGDAAPGLVVTITIPRQAGQDAKRKAARSGWSARPDL